MGPLLEVEVEVERHACRPLDEADEEALPAARRALSVAASRPCPPLTADMAAAVIVAGLPSASADEDAPAPTPPFCEAVHSAMMAAVALPALAPANPGIPFAPAPAPLPFFFFNGPPISSSFFLRFSILAALLISIAFIFSSSFFSSLARKAGLFAFCHSRSNSSYGRERPGTARLAPMEWVLQVRERIQGGPPGSVRTPHCSLTSRGWPDGAMNEAVVSVDKGTACLVTS